MEMRGLLYKRKSFIGAIWYRKWHLSMWFDVEFAYFMPLSRNFCSHCSSKMAFLTRKSRFSVQKLAAITYDSINSSPKLGKKYDDQIVKNVVMAKYPRFYGRKKKLVNL